MLEEVTNFCSYCVNNFGIIGGVIAILIATLIVSTIIVGIANKFISLIKGFFEDLFSNFIKGL